MTLVFLLLLACTSSDDPGDRQGPGGDTGGDGDTGSGTGGNGLPADDPDAALQVEGCRADRGPADAARLGLLSFPYDDGGGQADTWRQLRLDQGLLTVPADAPDLGRATGGRGVFTPDGSVAVVATSDGALSTWNADDGSSPTTGFDQGPYAGFLAMHPSGEHGFVADVNWPENGGGLYRFQLDCDDGGITGTTQLLEAKAAAAVLRRPGHADQFALVARELPGSPSGSTVHLLDLSGETPLLLSSADAFGDEDIIVSDAAWDFEGEHLLVADYNEWNDQPTRVAVLRAQGDSLVAVDVVEVDDPVAIVTAPWPQASALVLDGYGNRVLELARTGDPDAPFALAGTVASASLPGAAVGVRRGPDRGTVLVVENQGVRAVLLQEGGGAQDLGMATSFDGLAGIPGGIALQE